MHIRRGSLSLIVGMPVMHTVGQAMKSVHMSVLLCLKLNIYCTVVLPVALCGAECWPTTKRHQHALDTIGMQMIRWSLGGHIARSYYEQRHLEDLRSHPNSRQNERSEAVMVWTCGRRWCGFHCEMGTCSQPRWLTAPTEKMMEGLPAWRYASRKCMPHWCCRPDEVVGEM